MTQEEKDLLLKDLCARLPYGVKFKWCDDYHTDDYYTLIGINEGLITGRDVNQDDCLFFWGKDKIKSYLRPMSSMTEEEEKEYERLANRTIVNSVGFVYFDATELLDWLNKKMFDFRGLIPKDLALSTETFNPYKD